MLVQFLRSSFLVIPCLTLLLLLTEPISRSVLSMIWNLLDDDAFTWLSDSEFLSHNYGAEPATAACSFDRVRWVFDGAAQSTRLYKRGAARPEQGEGEEVHAVQCVFCLCDVEDGEEVRELRCEHLFHRSCLDRWVGFGRVTCPLCRKSLASKVVEAGPPCEEGVDQLSTAGAMFPVDPHGAWWAS